MFLPTVIGSTIKKRINSFCYSLYFCNSTYIYMSEVGGLLIGSKIPVSIKDLIIIFIERTLITLPIIVMIAHIYYFEYST